MLVILILIGFACFMFYLKNSTEKDAVLRKKYMDACDKVFKFKEAYVGYDKPEFIVEDYALNLEFLNDEIIRAYLVCLKNNTYVPEHKDLIHLLSETKDERIRDEILHLIINK